MRVYSILASTLKDEGKLLEAKGPVTDVAYSHDGAFLAVCDASKVVTVFSVADGYSVSRVQTSPSYTRGHRGVIQPDIVGLCLPQPCLHLHERQAPGGALGRML